MRYVVFILLFAAASPCLSQGTVKFANGSAGVDAPLTNYTVTPPVRADAGFRAQLYVGPAGMVNGSLLTTNGVSGTPATFLSGAGAGYFLGNARTIEGYLPGTTVTFQVRAWQASTGASWESAFPRYDSNLIQVTLGGGTIPTPNMIGLQGFAFPVPEPSSVAIATLGLLASVIAGLRRHSLRH